MTDKSNSLNEIRKTFLDYFADEDHQVVDSSSLVPQNDPTLMFTNAGMVQFKNVFTGLEKRDYDRAVTSQKCVRAGGKHNDLENVGYTARHHTFFEMLGNFSFGDYFKEHAIELAWNLITKEYRLDAKRLLVTVYAEDDVAYDLWKKIAGLPDEKIIRIGTSDNFWAMGDTGPCGPCSEIFYDHGDHIPGGPPGSPDEDGDRFVEIWNLVFMQYEQETPDHRIDLPKPSIDTGMGLERIGAVLQGTHDNYETDLFRTLILQSAQSTGTDPDGDHNVSHRVIADHLRASSFLIADGVLPSNEGRGYVLRRIMRRGMRHAHLLGATEPLMWRLVSTLVSLMGSHFKELGRAEPLITETLKLEESRFKRTLDRGLHLLDGEIDKLGSNQTLPGEVAFKLYDTYGFPLDLTEDALRPKGIKVDTEGFKTAMAHQKETARKSWAGSGEQATDNVWFSIREEVGATDFLGYTGGKAAGQVVALVRDGQQVKSAKEGEEIEVVLNQSPFYGESGGQVGDSGKMSNQDGLDLKVSDTLKRAGDLHVHRGTVVKGSINVGDNVDLQIDEDLRTRTRANHSATHLLHEALRQVLGDHVTQKGSLVDPDRLRFDIAHQKPLSGEEIDKVEIIVNQIIRQNGSVSTRLMTPDEAIEAGALALFGEKYGDEVRVLTMGEDKTKPNGVYSVELCGGTHVDRTGDIALLKITSESAVGAGLRRVEALTGDAARKYLNDRDRIASQCATVLKSRVEDIPERIASLVEERKRLEKELAAARKDLAMGGSGGTEPAQEMVNGTKLVARVVEGVSPRDLPGMIDDAKARMGSGVAVLVAVNDGKAALAVGITDDLTDRLNAVDLVKTAAAKVGGKGGGGRPDLAKAGGPDGGSAAQALDAVRAALEG